MAGNMPIATLFLKKHQYNYSVMLAQFHQIDIQTGMNSIQSSLYERLPGCCYHILQPFYQDNMNLRDKPMPAHNMHTNHNLFCSSDSTQRLPDTTIPFPEYHNAHWMDYSMYNHTTIRDWMYIH